MFGREGSSQDKVLASTRITIDLERDGASDRASYLNDRIGANSTLPHRVPRNPKNCQNRTTKSCKSGPSRRYISFPELVSQEKQSSKSIAERTLTSLKQTATQLAALNTITTPPDFRLHSCKILSEIQNIEAEIKKLTTKVGPTSEGTTIASTNKLYKRDFLFVEELAQPGRPMFIYHLKPVHVFAGQTGARPYQRQKTFGLVRLNSESQPLMCSVSGGHNYIKPHPKILDADLWTRLVKKWVAFFDQPFKISIFDRGRDGHCQATHVEPRLMLWFACYMVLEKGLKLTGDFEKLMGHIWELRRFPGIKAEILISHPNGKPCPDCRKFKEMFEEYSGIKYQIVSSENLGKVKMFRNSQGLNQVELEVGDFELNYGAYEPQNKKRSHEHLSHEVEDSEEYTSPREKWGKMKRRLKEESRRPKERLPAESEEDEDFTTAPSRHKKRKATFH